MVDYDFKLDIYFYEMLGNTNRKMSQKVYIDLIFQPIVKPWIEVHHNFVLEKDGDLGHGPRKSNILCTWKKTNGPEFYFNYHSSLNLTLIENC